MAADSTNPGNTKELAAYAKQLNAAKRLLRLKSARERFIDYVSMSMPDPAHPDDPDASRYDPQPHHELIASYLEKVETGAMPRLIVTVGPRAGKSELVSKRFPSWFVGRDPYRQVIVTSYGDGLAHDFGREVREVMATSFYNQVFPRTALRPGSRSKDRLQTTQGGTLVFTGAGGSITGRGADLAIIDDPIKDRQDANSRALRDHQWQWFTQVLMTRLMGAAARVVICTTRWHEDDLVGRLTNPKNPYYDPDEAKHWTVLNLPAFADDAGDPLGRAPGEILWPTRIPRVFLEGQRRLDPSGFAALYMGRPAPPEGNFFKKDMLKTYRPNELPANLRYYAASDHAVSLRDNRDPTCLGVVGVDDDSNIWVLPDLVWRQIGAEAQVEAMLDLMRRFAPLFWWAERGHITQSIGPFLNKRMLEENTFCTIVEKTPVKDKQTRAQAIQARMSMGKVLFPEFAPWWADAADELLNFPNGSHDDFADFLAWIGIGLGEQAAATPTLPKTKPIKTGTAQWIMASAAAAKRAREPHIEGYLH